MKTEPGGGSDDFPLSVAGTSDPTPARRDLPKPATLGSVDAKVDAEPLTVEQLEQGFDLAIEAGRLDVARRMNERIQALRGAS